MGTTLTARSEQITFRLTTENDLDFVIQNEHDAGNINLISQWPRELHRQALLDS